jgi:enamine deaminase RidA (YjgF/YER057c/UK114 family)
MREHVLVASAWGEAIGYSRAVRAGGLVFVSGTTASGLDPQAMHQSDVGKQTEVILERIGAALRELGFDLGDVVETRIYLTDIADWPAVGRIHGSVFRDIRPTTTILQVGPLMTPDLLVEISAVASRGAVT